MGVDVDGAFAEYVVRPARTLVRPPAPVDPVALAVLTDAVGTPYHALVRIAQLRASETLLVLGVGGIGSNAVQLGSHLGARVWRSRGAKKRALARELGPRRLSGSTQPRGMRCVRAGRGHPVRRLRGARSGVAELAGYGARVVFVGTVPEAVRARRERGDRRAGPTGSRGFTAEDIAEVIDFTGGSDRRPPDRARPTIGRRQRSAR
jgi:D-arabinose 1-dehydrogenase-like Zn-dependent alcohol dehydrogenase